MTESDPHRTRREAPQPVEEGIGGQTWLIILAVLVLVVLAAWWMPPGLMSVIGGVFRILGAFK